MLLKFVGEFWSLHECFGAKNFAAREDRFSGWQTNGGIPLRTPPFVEDMLV
jgi:hypothetical protein